MYALCCLHTLAVRVLIDTLTLVQVHQQIVRFS